MTDSRAIEIGARAMKKIRRAEIEHGKCRATYEEMAEACLTALAAEGYVVMPREPTTQQMEAAGNAVAEYAKKMTQAGGDVDATDYALRAVIYRAMIRATQEISNASD